MVCPRSCADTYVLLYMRLLLDCALKLGAQRCCQAWHGRRLHACLTPDICINMELHTLQVPSWQAHKLSVWRLACVSRHPARDSELFNSPHRYLPDNQGLPEYRLSQ